MDDNTGDFSDLRYRIQKAIASYEDEIVEFTRELIEIRTENPPGRFYRECAEVIAIKLQEIGLSCELVEVPGPAASGREGAGSGRDGPAAWDRDGPAPERDDPATGLDGPATGHDTESLPRYCLLAFHGRGAKTLYFHGHYDVVPASSRRQFSPRVKNGAIVGRGSSDMKGGLASMVYAVKALKACEVPLDGKICLTFVPDEETGGALGSAYLKKIGKLGKDGVGMLTAEPTSGAIWNASRGALSLRVTVKGKPAHVGLHYQGVNAFEQMMTVCGALLELKSDVESRKTNFRIAPDEARRSILLIGGRCGGGTNFNVVPGECSFTVDRRINPEENLADETDRLFTLFDALRNKGIDMTVEVLQEGEASGVSETTTLALALKENVSKISGGTPSFELCPGLLETRFYASLGLPALAYGPGLLSVSHGPDELVKIEDLCNCAVIYALTAAEVLAV